MIYTYRYCFEFCVCLCCATENPNKLSLVWPSLMTGNRTSMLNPWLVRVVENSAKKHKCRVLGAMFNPPFASHWKALLRCAAIRPNRLYYMHSIGSNRPSPFTLANRVSRCLLVLPLSSPPHPFLAASNVWIPTCSPEEFYRSFRDV